MASLTDNEVLAAKIMGKTSDSDALASLMKSAQDVDDDDLDDDLDDEDSEDDEDALPNDGDEDEDDSDDESQEDDEEEDDNSSEGDDEDESATVEYNDDDVFEVAVDGQKREVTLKQLLQNYSGEGAIEKRLQEATELRKAAIADREAAATEIETHRTNLLQTIAKLDQALFMPLVKKPDPALRTKNMQEYLLQKDAYDEDQNRIGTLKSNLTGMLADEQKRAVQAKADFRRKQAELLVLAAPELKTPETAKAFQDDLMVAVNHYGITEAHMQEVDNHVLFLLARDAGRWLKMQNGKKSGLKGAVPKAGETRPRRRMKPGGASSATNSKQKVSKQIVAAKAAAQKSGSVDDLATALAMQAAANLKRK
jgi:hypothetical protein